jgi:hypothetical protein
MPPVKSVTCPYCEGEINRRSPFRPNGFSVSVNGVDTVIVACPHCNKALGAATKPE